MSAEYRVPPNLSGEETEVVQRTGVANIEEIMNGQREPASVFFSRMIGHLKLARATTDSQVKDDERIKAQALATLILRIPSHDEMLEVGRTFLQIRGAVVRDARRAFRATKILPPTDLDFKVHFGLPLKGRYPNFW